ncbi:DUF6090 family protein [Flavobacteriaceae sp. LMIT009]
MIKFFKSIRQELVMKNDTSKYFKYAIGEVVLVMVGILLALQVNNWNNTRAKKQLEKTVLLQLKEDLGSMLNDLRGDKDVLKKGIESHLNIVEYIDKDLKYNDTMCFDFHWLIRDEYMYPITSAYNVLRKEGLDLISNDSIRNRTQNVFEFMLPRISKENPFYPDLEEFFNDFYHKNFGVNKDSTLKYTFELYEYKFEYPYTDSFEGRNFDVYQGYVPNDFEALKKSSEFQVLLRQAFRYRNFKYNRYQSAIQILEELYKKIGEELNIPDD